MSDTEPRPPGLILRAIVAVTVLAVFWLAGWCLKVLSLALQ